MNLCGRRPFISAPHSGSFQGMSTVGSKMPSGSKLSFSAPPSPEAPFAPFACEPVSSLLLEDRPLRRPAAPAWLRGRGCSACSPTSGLRASRLTCFGSDSNPTRGRGPAAPLGKVVSKASGFNFARWLPGLWDTTAGGVCSGCCSCLKQDTPTPGNGLPAQASQTRLHGQGYPPSSVCR